jgi:hypothetical protein
MKQLSKILGVGSLCLGLGCATAWAQSNRETRELAGQITNGPAVLQVYRITTLPDQHPTGASATAPGHQRRLWH